MKNNSRFITFLSQWVLTALAVGCTPVAEETPDPKDTANDSASGLMDTESAALENPRCANLEGIDFGDCDVALGVGIRFGMCVNLFGCEGHGLELFESQEACEATCTTKEEFCLATGGQWSISTRGGDFVCGQPPAACSNPDCDVPYLPGCNCGMNRKWDATLGCVSDDSCVAPSCDDNVDVDFQYLGNCIVSLGWMVRDGSCQEVKGCANLSFGFFATRDDCNTVCVTPQRRCMESGGAWLGADSFTPTKSDIYYDCGEQLHMIDPPLAPCNCGPSANYVNGVGCESDAACSGVIPVCPTYDFGVDYPADPKTTAAADCDWDPPNAPGLIPVGGGLVNGNCQIFFACILDFEGPLAWVDPADWFDSQDACDTACSPRCASDADCPDPDPADDMGTYCHFEKDSNCGAFTNGGICTESGGSCGGGYDPVCGCDGDYVSNEACIGIWGRPMRHEGQCFTFPPLP